MAQSVIVGSADDRETGAEFGANVGSTLKVFGVLPGIVRIGNEIEHPN